MSEFCFKSKKGQSAGKHATCLGKGSWMWQGKGRGAQPSAASVGLRGWEMVVFLKGRSDSADEGRMAESVEGTSRGVP